MNHKPQTIQPNSYGKEFKNMEDKKVEELEEQEGKEKKKIEEKLPYCTTAPSAEQVRANDEDEPCDDSRSGDVKQE